MFVLAKYSYSAETKANGLDVARIMKMRTTYIYIVFLI
jgi:hypothetical protein